MKFAKFYLIQIVVLFVFISGCSSVPITGRKQLNIIPASTMLSMSYQQYDDFLKSNKAITGTPQAQQVKNIGAKIQKAVETYFAQKGISGDLKGYEWEFNLVDNKEINAWCMPGGKVVVYSGILPLTKDENGLAVVMGHEIAHAIAEHGGERMSQGLITQLGGIALSEAVKNKPQETQALWMAAFGVGAQVGVLLPYSRLHESEADRLGLIFMAMAGYDPNGAVPFWQRMAQMKQGQAPPEFLSTHPSDATRIKKIQEQLPEALKYYKG